MIIESYTVTIRNRYKASGIWHGEDTFTVEARSPRGEVSNYGVDMELMLTKCNGNKADAYASALREALFMIGGYDKPVLYKKGLAEHPKGMAVKITQ
ncbi:MAG: hypothetical protein KAR06_06955 [Deltaproteobacteria bacterium]|nr:hypothetical protein [Deltaproteobacteria bacterium]